MPHQSSIVSSLCSPTGGAAAVTFAFLGIRPDRPDDYYCQPLADFLTRISSAREQCSLSIYSSSTARDNLPRFAFGQLNLVEPEALMAEVWRVENGLHLYHRLLKANPTHSTSYQARFPRLIAVYLAKIAAIKQSFTSGAKTCFWFDAGHWVSYQCQHDIHRYTSSIQDAVVGDTLIARLDAAAERYGVIGCEALPGKTCFHMPLDWMYHYAYEMKYAHVLSLPLVSAVFILVHSRCIQAFFDSFQKWWQRLISDNKAGIEENALTLAFWENQWRTLTYADWIGVLCGDSIP